MGRGTAPAPHPFSEQRICLLELKELEGECVTHLSVLRTCIMTTVRGLLASSIMWKDNDK